MSNSLSGYCGTVSSTGQIVSNGNFSCQSGGGQYTVNYNGACTNPVPIITLVNAPLGSTLVLQDSDNQQFVLFVYDKNGVPVECGFNFVVAQIV